MGVAGWGLLLPERQRLHVNWLLSAEFPLACKGSKKIPISLIFIIVEHITVYTCCRCSEGGCDTYAYVILNEEQVITPGIHVYHTHTHTHKARDSKHAKFEELQDTTGNLHV